VKSATLRYGEVAEAAAAAAAPASGAAACSVPAAESAPMTGSVSVGTARASAECDRTVASDVGHVIGSPVSWSHTTTVVATSVWSRKRSRIACLNVAGPAERGDSLGRKSDRKRSNPIRVSEHMENGHCSFVCASEPRNSLVDVAPTRICSS
jgi:hypothetical protein